MLRWLGRTTAVGTSLSALYLWWTCARTPLWVAFWPLIWLMALEMSQHNFDRLMELVEFWRKEVARQHVIIVRMKLSLNHLFGKFVP